MSNTCLPRSRRHARRPLAACLAVALLAPTALALAAPAVVNCDDSGAGSLRASIAAAGSSDVIDLSGLSCNAISLASALQTNGIADLTVRAGAAQNFSIAGSGADRVFSHAGSGRLRGTPNSEALHIVERFTMLNADTIQWTMTVEDPAAFTRPWTVSLLLDRSDDYQMYEYACHEGNQAIELVLRGARAEEQR